MGFEPTCAVTQLAFKASAFDHSTTHPSMYSFLCISHSPPHGFHHYHYMYISTTLKSFHRHIVDLLDIYICRSTTLDSYSINIVDGTCLDSLVCEKQIGVQHYYRRQWDSNPCLVTQFTLAKWRYRPLSDTSGLSRYCKRCLLTFRTRVHRGLDSNQQLLTLEVNALPLSYPCIQHIHTACYKTFICL